jgi:hypothetical protein
MSATGLVSEKHGQPHTTNKSVRDWPELLAGDEVQKALI